MTLLSNRAPVQISPVISPKNIFYGPYVINFFKKIQNPVMDHLVLYRLL